MGRAAASGDGDAEGLKSGVYWIDWTMQDTGKMLVILGLLIVVIGAWVWSGRGFGWLGRLPGDISYQNGDFRFYFPVTTCILVSVLLTVLAWFVRR